MKGENKHNGKGKQKCDIQMWVNQSLLGRMKKCIVMNFNFQLFEMSYYSQPSYRNPFDVVPERQKFKTCVHPYTYNGIILQHC